MTCTPRKNEKKENLLKASGCWIIVLLAMAKRALGKGLGALIKQQNSSVDTLNVPSSSDVVHHVSHDSVEPSSLQPRALFTEDQLAELVDSIREHGIIQPLIVRKSGNKHELIAGERRWRAAAILKLSTVPVIIRQASDRDVLEMALIENLQRENLSPLEEAAGYMRLKNEFKLKQDEIAKRVGKSRATVANSIRLLDLADEVQQFLCSGSISVGHAKALLGLKDPASQSKLAAEVVRKGMTVRQTEQAVQKELTSPPPSSPAKKSLSPVYSKVSDYLTRQLSAPVSINAQGSKGTIEISYQNKDDLVRIIELLGIDTAKKMLS